MSKALSLLELQDRSSEDHLQRAAEQTNCKLCRCETYHVFKWVGHGDTINKGSDSICPFIFPTLSSRHYYQRAAYVQYVVPPLHLCG